MVVPLGQVRTPREFYGMRQNMDISHPVYRQYSERVIRKIAERYAKHPGVIGWQVDNETGAYGRRGPTCRPASGVAEGQVRHGRGDEQAWGLVYWGQLVGSWDELPPRDGILNPAGSSSGERYQRSLVTDFLGWQPGSCGSTSRPRSGSCRTSTGHATAVDSGEISSSSTWPHQPLPRHAGAAGRLVDRVHGDFTRVDEAGAYLVTETNAQAIAGTRGASTAVDGQLRLQAWAHVRAGPTWWSTGTGTRSTTPGDLLEGPARPRPRAEPGLRGGHAHRPRS